MTSKQGRTTTRRQRTGGERDWLTDGGQGETEETRCTHRASSVCARATAAEEEESCVMAAETATAAEKLITAQSAQLHNQRVGRRQRARDRDKVKDRENTETETETARERETEGDSEGERDR
jgi:hypothetical protein